jgi:hypothetical protein
MTLRQALNDFRRKGCSLSSQKLLIETNVHSLKHVISQVDTLFAVSAQNYEGISHFSHEGLCPPLVQIVRLLIMQHYAISDPKFVQEASTPLLLI